MLKCELPELIATGESSSVEFKCDDIRPEQLAREVVALVNHRGGHALLGVGDDGSITGVQREDLERWVMDTVFARYTHLDPAVIRGGGSRRGETRRGSCGNAGSR